MKLDCVYIPRHKAKCPASGFFLTRVEDTWQRFWLMLYALRHRSILGAAGHIILTPANQLIVMGPKIWSLFNPGSNQRPFDHWLTSLPTALTGPTLDKIYVCKSPNIIHIVHNLGCNCRHIILHKKTRQFCWTVDDVTISTRTLEQNLIQKVKTWYKYNKTRLVHFTIQQFLQNQFSQCTCTMNLPSQTLLRHPYDSCILKTGLTLYVSPHVMVTY
jgi:hypothetical protein